MKKVVLILAAVGFMTSCGNESSSNKAADKVVEAVTEVAASDHSIHMVEKCLPYYMEMKDALVAADQVAAKSAAEGMLGTVMHDEMKTALQDIVSGVDVAAQRVSFEKVSIMLYDQLSAGTSVTGAKVYKQYCPMAFDNKGAFWLSNEAQVVNPYFGDMMLNCGKVQEEISI